VAKERKPRRFAPAVVISDTAEPAKYAAMQEGNVWPLLDMLRSETCPRAAREFAADLIEGKVALPKKKPKLDPAENGVIATYAVSVWGPDRDPKKLKAAVIDTAKALGCSKSKVYAALRWLEGFK
jgi:hypothetical protein